MTSWPKRFWFDEVREPFIKGQRFIDLFEDPRKNDKEKLIATRGIFIFNGEKNWFYLTRYHTYLLRIFMHVIAEAQGTPKSRRGIIANQIIEEATTIHKQNCQTVWMLYELKCFRPDTYKFMFKKSHSVIKPKKIRFETVDRIMLLMNHAGYVYTKRPMNKQHGLLVKLLQHRLTPRGFNFAKKWCTFDE